VSHAPHLPVVDIASLLAGSDPSPAAFEIDRACREVGFFGIVGHGVDPALQERLEAASHEFFALPDSEKSAIAMARSGAAWRGWFPVGGELTSGAADRKEGIYFGVEHDRAHPRVADATPLHGPNQFPAVPSQLGPAVLDWLTAMRPIADAVLRGIAVGLGLPAAWFEDELTSDPTILFRIFHYPPGGADDEWGVGEHSDYGLLTLLAQDHNGGLQVKSLDGAWFDVEPTPGVLVCNLGDMLERLTGGRYRSTPHRVRNSSGNRRLSFPYFFDPSWDATVPTLPLDRSPSTTNERWDGADVTAWEGRYGDYLTAKVAKVFPELFDAIDPTSSRAPASPKTE
jgi:isopenicillin N synthase-like dioxygenase